MVVSSNTVGYQRMNLDAGYNMIGVQFVEVGTGANVKDVSTIGVLSSDMAGFDEDGNYATEMMVWRNGNYLPTFGWSGTSASEYMDEPTLDKKWLNLAYEETEDTLASYDAFWIKSSTGGTITISGQVPTNDVTVALAAGYNMVANPFPKAVKVSDFGVLSDTMPGFDEDGNYAVEMMVWQNGNYLPTFGWSGTSASEYMDEPTLDNKWLNLAYEETDDEVEFGHAVWIKSSVSGSITFTFSAE